MLRHIDVSYRLKFKTRGYRAKSTSTHILKFNLVESTGRDTGCLNAVCTDYLDTDVNMFL